MNECLVCQRIDSIINRKNHFFVAELQTGYVVLSDVQTYQGYTLFLSKIHASELHELDKPVREKFLLEMSEVAHCVYTTFKPKKLNYELLGNTDPHLHWHIIPRRESDLNPETGIWAMPKEQRSLRLEEEEINIMRYQLLETLLANTAIKVLNQGNIETNK